MMNISNSRSRRSGFTLIEVAIALAIFVFGALAIIQIFPPALGVVRNNESRVAATQLGETMLARTSGKPSSVPDAIYDGDATGVWQDTPAAVVGTASKNASLPAGMEAVNFTTSALGRFKYVTGERHKVRSAASVQYVLLNSPYANDVKVYREGVVNGVRIGEDGILDFTYAITSQGVAYHHSTYPNQAPDLGTDVTYYVSYHWREGTQVHGVLDEPIKLDAPATNSQWSGNDGKVAQQLIDSTTNRIAPGVITVRYRLEVATIANVIDNAARGYLDLSGIGVTAGEELSFDYLVSDWRDLVDDSNVPMNSGTVQLPIKNLDEFPVVGVQTTIGDSANPALLIPSPVNYKNGTVGYPVISGRRYRTVYRALDGWAQQLSVAAKTYIPFYEDGAFAAASPASRPAALLPREPWREYYWPGTGNQLYFHPSEAGKSVVVSLTDGAGQRMNGIVLTIDKMEASTVPPTGFFGTGNTTNQVAYATLTDLAGNPVAASSILSVQGLSVQARTAWQNADRYNQVIVPAYRTLLQ